MSIATAKIKALEVGDYFAKYEDHTNEENEGSRCGYGDDDLAEVDRLLGKRGLKLVADDVGLLVTAAPDAQCPEHGCARWRCDAEH